MKDFLLGRGKRTNLNYFNWMGIATILLYMVFRLIAAYNISISNEIEVATLVVSEKATFVVPVRIAVIFYFYISTILGMQRLRDIGKKPIFALALSFPCVMYIPALSFLGAGSLLYFALMVTWLCIAPKEGQRK